MRQSWSRRPGALFFLLTSYLLWGAVALRWIVEFIEQNHPRTGLITGMLLLFGLLMGVEPVLTGRSPLRSHLYLAFQTGLVFAASLFYFELDFFALLYVPLVGQAIYLFPRRLGLLWLGILVAMTAVGQTIQFGGIDALSFILLYSAALFFVAALVSTVLRMDDSRRRSERLLAELEEAHGRLQAYADQAEELAIANERTRLARDLHDSVAQTLYGLTLQAEAASRRLTAGHQDAVHGYLNAMREDAQQTLQETRLLIFELRPPLLESSGLAGALRARLDSVEARSGIVMELQLQDIDGLDPAVETGLYRIAQEGLNNMARHARATTLRVLLAREDDRVTLEIADDGIGFDLAAVPAGSVGLRGMAERVQQLNGRLRVESAPGQGTTIHVEVPL